MITLHELRVPEPSEVEAVYKKMTAAATIESPNQLNRNEYLTIMFKVTQDGDEWLLIIKITHRLSYSSIF